MNKATKITIVPTIYVSKFAPGFMLHMDCAFFNAESIRRFASKILAVNSSTAYPFGFTSRVKCRPIDILNFLVATLRNQDNKFAFILVDEN